MYIEKEYRETDRAHKYTEKTGNSHGSAGCIRYTLLHRTDTGYREQVSVTNIIN